jgi:glycosyltransferase involved in cell wall biosynthesis
MKTTTPPLFTIVIPAFNRSNEILPTLESVKAQTFVNFECIIVDDGSDEGYLLEAVIEKLNDDRFIYVWRENGGGGAARNTGIEMAKGEFIAFLDSDDIFLPNKLQVCTEQLTKDPLMGIYSFMYVDRGVSKYWVRPNRAIKEGEDMGEYLFVQNEFIQTSTIVLPTIAAKKTMFDPTLRKGQDLDFCLRLHRDGVRFNMIKIPLTIWVDKTEVGRTSRVSGYKAPLEWLDRSLPLLTHKAVLGYRATVLFYYMAKSKPFISLKYLFQGWWLAGVPFRIIIRQFLRGFLPRGLYRKLVNKFVHNSGKKVDV